MLPVHRVRTCGSGQYTYPTHPWKTPGATCSSDKCLFCADSVAGPVLGSQDKAGKQARPGQPSGNGPVKGGELHP